MKITIKKSNQVNQRIDLLIPSIDNSFSRSQIQKLIKDNLVTVNKKLNSLIFEMKSDFGRRIGKNGRPLFKPGEISRIQNAFDLIPTFLAKENKRFIVSKVTGGLQYDKNDLEFKYFISH